MTVRIKFSKYGSMKFIGHLDTMRYFQKAIRRAGFSVVYSQGFSPHQIMAFASPLGVGLTSDAEYFDVELSECQAPEEMTARLNEVMADEIEVTGFQVLPELLPNQRKETAMSLVAAADYLISRKDGTVYELTNQEFEHKFKEFMERPEIRILKKSKKSEKEADIRPFIYEFAFPDQDAYRHSHAEQYENGLRIFVRTAAGSVANLKPELIMEAFSVYAGIPFRAFDWQVHRLEVYKDTSLAGMSQLQIKAASEEGRLPERALVPLNA